MSENLKLAMDLIAIEQQNSENRNANFKRDLLSKTTCNLASIAAFAGQSQKIGIGIQAALILVYLLEHGEAIADDIRAISINENSNIRDAFRSINRSTIDRFIVRKNSQIDGRNKLYSLTPEGVKAAASLKVIIDSDID